MTSPMRTSLPLPVWPYQQEIKNDKATDIEIVTSEPSDIFDCSLPKLVELPKILVSAKNDEKEASIHRTQRKVKDLGDNLSDRFAKKPKTLETNKSNTGEPTVRIKPPLLRDPRSLSCILTDLSELRDVPSLKRPAEDSIAPVPKKKKSIEEHNEKYLNNLMGEIATDPSLIKVIDLSNHGIYSLKFIQCCTTLKKLNVSGTQVSNLEGVPTGKLKTLFMNDCLYLKSLTCLPLTNRIKKLSLRNCVNLTKIGKFQNLEEVDLTGCTNLTTLRPFEDCFQLEKLHLGRNDNLSSNELKLLKNCTELTIYINELQIPHNKLNNKGLDIAFKTFMHRQPAGCPTF